MLGPSQHGRSMSYHSTAIASTASFVPRPDPIKAPDMPSSISLPETQVWPDFDDPPALPRPRRQPRRRWAGRRGRTRRMERSTRTMSARRRSKGASPRPRHRFSSSRILTVGSITSTHHQWHISLRGDCRPSTRHIGLGHRAASLCTASFLLAAIPTSTPSQYGAGTSTLPAHITGNIGCRPPELARLVSPLTLPAWELTDSKTCPISTDSEGGTERDDKERSDTDLEKGDADKGQSGDDEHKTEATGAIIDADDGSSERQSEWIEERQASHEDHFDPPSFVSRASRFTNLFDGVDRAMRQPHPRTCASTRPPPPPPPPLSSADHEDHDTPDTPSESGEVSEQ